MEAVVALVVCGVSGAGKSTVGSLLAQHLGWKFFDADDFHPPANVAKMRRGEPLTDEDRGPWLDALRALIERHAAEGRHLVLATEATVRLGAYRRAISALDPGAHIKEQACEMLVSLAEEGWTAGPIAESIVQRYLDEAAADGFRADSIILGCTHFPLLRDTISAAAGPAVAVVDSANTTAAVVQQTLRSAGRLSANKDAGELMLLATDGISRFARVGGQFLGRALSAADVHLVDL